MNFDEVKENIQPLVSGRNALILESSLRQGSPQELLEKRRELEATIHNYVGDDPLIPWYNYIIWIEQSFPSSGKESGLEEAMRKCLLAFADEKCYFQDRRMIKLLIKFIEHHRDPINNYQLMYSAGIGTMVSDFYISWAYCYDNIGNVGKADEIFRLGINCRAEPLDEIKEAFQHFQQYIGARYTAQDDLVRDEAINQLEERRLALSSLRSLGNKKVVGSLRTGNAIQSQVPGKLSDGPNMATISLKSKPRNDKVIVYSDENLNPTEYIAKDLLQTDVGNMKSTIFSIVALALENENQTEPGPWNKNRLSKPGRIFMKTKKSINLGFDIHIDDNKITENSTKELIYELKPLLVPIKNFANNFEKPLNIPKNFVSCNRPQISWDTPVTIENESNAYALPEYNKIMLYPRFNMEFQMEELRSYYFYKRRKIKNEFTLKRDPVWSTYDMKCGVRMYPNFSMKSRNHVLTEVDKFYRPEIKTNMVVTFSDIYNMELHTEFQLEEIRNQYRNRNVTNIGSVDMEMTFSESYEDKKGGKNHFNRKSMSTKLSCIPENKNTLSTISESLESSSINLEEAKCTTYKCSEENNSVDVKHLYENIGFEIFEDPTTTIPINSKRKREPPFEFKTPAPPQMGKLPFEPHENDRFKSLLPSPDNLNAYADDEDTCSTQVFNIFLKSELVSTPKAFQKTASRQMGTVLKIVQSREEMADNAVVADNYDDKNLTPTNKQEGEKDIDVNQLTENLSLTPQKQLSTILELSEHGTTHTTVASTKSTMSSSGESDKSEQKVTQIKHQSISSNISHLPTTLKPTHAGVTQLLSPSSIRYQQLEGLTDSRRRVGNFSRLEETDDPATLILIPSMHSKDNKIESTQKPIDEKRDGEIKFNDEKTETISKILFSGSNEDKYGSGESSKNILKAISNLPTVNTSFSFGEINSSHPINSLSFKKYDNMEISTIATEKSTNHSTQVQQKVISKSGTRIDDSMSEIRGISFAQQKIACIDILEPNKTKPSMLSFKKHDGVKSTSVTMQEKTNCSAFMGLFEFQHGSSCQENSETGAKIEDSMPDMTALSFVQQKITSPQHFQFYKSIENGTQQKLEPKTNKNLILDDKITKNGCTNIYIQEESTAKTFELNTETEIFSANLSGISNSTFLSNQLEKVQLSKQQESLPIKIESLSIFTTNTSNSESFQNEQNYANNISHKYEIDRNSILESTNIYKKKNCNENSKQYEVSAESELKDNITIENESHLNTDLNYTQSVVEFSDHQNPFNPDLIHALLEEIDFTSYIRTLSNCSFQERVQTLNSSNVISCCGTTFTINKLIGEGAYGSVFIGINNQTGVKHALKQERPRNLWEFYICLEVHCRLKSSDLELAYMNIDFALIGNNSSVFISTYSPYGSLVNVSNKIKNNTTRNIDELVVMFITCELLDIVDHLHAINIIHADFKADNILLINTLKYPTSNHSMQLIDFGTAIDMRRFKKDQTFTYKFKEDLLKCVEMRENCGWTYQLDLFGLAGVIHVLLFGKYMIVEKRSTGLWMPAIRIPRYYNNTLWETIFKALLNVRLMPNLQQLRAMLKEELVNSEKNLHLKLSQFNNAISQ